MPAREHSANFFKKNSNFAERRPGALGKEFFLKKIKNLCRVPAGLALGKETINGAGAVTVAFLCRVPRGSRQSLCRVPDKRHSAKRALPINFLPCVLCRVQFGLCRVPQALDKEPESSSERACSQEEDDQILIFYKWNIRYYRKWPSFFLLIYF